MALRLRRDGVFTEQAVLRRGGFVFGDVSNQDLFEHLPASPPVPLPSAEDTHKLTPRSLEPAAASPKPTDQPLGPSFNVKPLEPKPTEYSAPATADAISKIRPSGPVAETDPDQIRAAQNQLSASSGGSPPSTYASRVQSQFSINGKASIGVRHTFMEIETTLVERVVVSSNGSPMPVVPIDPELKHEFPMSMHLDMLRLQYELSPNLSVYADIGTAYDTLKDLSFAYGAGFRWFFYKKPLGFFGHFYSAFEPTYLSGKLKKEYESNSNKWEKESDWRMLETRLKFGLVRPPWAFYAGGGYLVYQEDSDRKLIGSTLPQTVYFKTIDQSDPRYRLGFFAGIEYNFWRAFFLQLDAQLMNINSITVHLDYHF